LKKAIDGMIWVGTSGFQYPEWKGTFSPAKLATKKMLAYYGTHFPTTESNYNFRTIPSVETLSNWSAETPANFRFGLKAPQEITHFKKLRGCDAVVAQFWEVASTLKQKLGVVLFQLPPYFKKDLPVFNDFLALLPSSMKCAFEFRHESWFGEEVFALLRTKNAAFCIADSEKLKTPVHATTGFTYFRLREDGYTKGDIGRWAEVIGEQGKQVSDVYVYFKHEESGVGPKFGVQLMELLGPQAARSATP
jgi:uncharacterized protein YecE (DUF72 family)